MLFVVGYNVAHHNGLLGSFDIGGGTRLTDWIDLLTPFVVLMPLWWFLALQRPHRWGWIVAAIGSILYVEGHGIHLSANSISNVVAAEPATDWTVVDIVHLWDEVVGHYLWFLGLAVVLTVCAITAHRHPLGVPTWAIALGGAVSGLTWATNGLEGGTAVFSLICAVLAIALATARGRADGRGLSAAFVAGGIVAVVVLGAYGIAHGGFPQPSAG